MFRPNNYSTIWRQFLNIFSIKNAKERINELGRFAVIIPGNLLTLNTHFRFGLIIKSLGNQLVYWSATTGLGGHRDLIIHPGAILEKKINFKIKILYSLC